MTTHRETVNRMDRREFFVLAGKRGLQLGLAGVTLPALLAACGRGGRSVGSDVLDPGRGGGKIVGDVVDYALAGDWEGAFGSVTFRLQRGIFDGHDVFFIRTDASDEQFAKDEGLVWVPKMAVLAGKGPTADAYTFENGAPGQATVLSTQPGRRDYTPAWRISRARWRRNPRVLRSVADVEAARAAGDLAIERTPIILNGPVVKWSAGEMAVDTERKEYLGGGQLLSAPNVADLTVTFKLHECFPGVRYIVTDTALAPMAEGMKVVHSPALAPTTKAGATGRTNVFMNGVKGHGPMGFQPSVFDSKAGTPAWSPFWDHMTYAWKDGKTPRVLREESDIHAARDAGELEEFPGVPDTKGKTFVVNCPVPVLAPNSI